MPGRSGRHGRDYDDPYTYDDPYRHEAPNLGQNVGYEYVGTDEPGNPESPPPRYESRRSSPQRRKHRTTSPPRSRHVRDNFPPRARGSSPPRSGRKQHSGEGRGEGLQHSASQKQNKKNYQDRYQEWSRNPNVQKAGVYGKKGLQFMGSAAAAYLAAQNGGGPSRDTRSRSMDRGTPSRHGYDDRRRRGHRREPSYSPSPSPSPDRRRHRRHEDTGRASKPRRHDSYSESPPRRRHHDDDRDRDRDRDRHGKSSRKSSRHRRDPSYSRSPSPRGRGIGRSNTTKSSGGFRRSFSESMKPPNPDVAARWQMAARAALEAGGVAAFRMRKEPGSWTGQKGAKVATAALGAAAIDAFIDKDPRREKSGMKGMAENVIGGLIASKVTGMKGSTRHNGRPRYSR